MEHVHEAHACCHQEAPQVSAHAHHARQGSGAPMTPARLATAATIHCLTGCAIGEWIGLLIGVGLQLAPMTTMMLATAMGFASGFALGLRPLLQQGIGLGDAFKAIWLGELVSIAVMELAMNVTDYWVGGVAVRSIFAPQFWLGYAAALPAGFLAAWPANYWLLKSSIKKPCH